MKIGPYDVRFRHPVFSGLVISLGLMTGVPYAVGRLVSPFTPSPPNDIGFFIWHWVEGIFWIMGIVIVLYGLKLLFNHTFVIETAN